MLNSTFLMTRQIAIRKQNATGGSPSRPPNDCSNPLMIDPHDDTLVSDSLANRLRQWRVDPIKVRSLGGATTIREVCNMMEKVYRPVFYSTVNYLEQFGALGRPSEWNEHPSRVA